MSASTYSNLAHIPWTIGITLAGVGLHLLGVPVSFIAATGGFIMCFTREVTQREYQIIETLTPPLRAGLKELDAFKFWHWNRHSILETIYAVVAGYAVAALVYWQFGL